MKYNSNSCTLELSVGELCSLALKSGDIDARRKNSTFKPILDKGTYEKLQAEANGYYSADIPLSNTFLYNGMYYTVSGSADGVIRDSLGYCIDEINRVGGVDFFRPPTEIMLGRLKCHAYFFACKENITEIRSRITYLSQNGKKIKYINYTFNTEDLKKYYVDLIAKISFFAELEVKHTLEVITAAKNAVFPYHGLRDGQGLMIKESFGAIKRGQRLFAEAPTGIGKTISSLFPAVRALGEGYIQRIFYLTAKASTRREAYAGASKLFSVGIGIRAIVLSSKESMCRCPNAKCEASKNICSSDNCPLAKGYYDRVNEALKELLTSSNGYPPKQILSVAEKYSLCPYELSLDLSEYCDVIICDYNYVFDPSAYLKRYFSDSADCKKNVFLIDEAHNLSDRARDMYSARISLSDFSLPVEAEPNIFCIEIKKAFENIKSLCSDNIHVSANGDESGFYMSREPLGAFLSELELFRKKCDAWLKKNTDSIYYDAIYVLCSRVRKYLCVSEYYGKGFLTYVELVGRDISVRIFCLDPSRLMNRLLKRAHASILFSATLTPTEYFTDVLGCGSSAVELKLPSPFANENLCIAVADFLSVRYGDRDVNTSQFVSVIAATVSAKHGNYMVYFPSYSCLEKVSGEFKRKYPNVATVVQKKGMGYDEKEKFLSFFKADSGKLRIGFCVLGGSFSEGVDLPGSRLIGTVIFGVGLPGFSNERNIIRDYYNENDGSGYDYAYTYPGMNNVLQAAGRVIRTADDKGIVVLVDDRYATPAYRRLYPSHWKNVQYAGNAKSLAEISRRFWKNSGK